LPFGVVLLVFTQALLGVIKLLCRRGATLLLILPDFAGVALSRSDSRRRQARQRRRGVAQHLAAHGVGER
jgi:hypothetical protein